jgi:hypothetical protein
MIEVGVCSAGLTTMQLPAARQGAIFHAAILLSESDNVGTGYVERPDRTRSGDDGE